MVEIDKLKEDLPKVKKWLNTSVIVCGLICVIVFIYLVDAILNNQYLYLLGYMAILTMGLIFMIKVKMLLMHNENLEELIEELDTADDTNKFALLFQIYFKILLNMPMYNKWIVKHPDDIFDGKGL